MKTRQTVKASRLLLALFLLVFPICAQAAPSSPLASAEEIKTLAENVSAYRVGELWGIVLSDGSVVCEPKYSWCTTCGCEQCKTIGETVTLIAYSSEEGFRSLSCRTGEDYAAHYGHGPEPIGSVKPEGPYERFERNGLFGFRSKDTWEEAFSAQFSSASEPMQWNGKNYAWGKDETGWKAVWLDPSTVWPVETVEETGGALLVDADLFPLRFREAVEAYNAQYGTSLLCPEFYTVSHDSGKMLSCRWPYEGTSPLFDFWIDYDSQGRHIADDSLLRVYDGDYEDGSFLQSPYFPYVYITASCFANGTSAAERLQAVVSAMDVEHTYQNAVLVSEKDGTSILNSPSYRNETYLVQFRYGELCIFEP